MRWCRLGVVDKIFVALSSDGHKPERIMIDATHLKAHRTAASLLKKGMFPAISGVRKADSAGQVSDHKGASMVLDDLPAASHLIADRGYDSSWFGKALLEKGIEPCIPSSRSRKVPFPHNKIIYRQRHRVENLFARLKDWRRIATQYNRCAHTCFSPICIAVTIICWISEA